MTGSCTLRYKAFLFDLDGVLVDTAKYHYQAWKRLAEELHIPFDEKKNEEFKGVSRSRCMELLNEWGNLNLSEEKINVYATRKNQWYAEFLQNLNRSEMLPGALDALKAAERRGVKCAICSASKNTMTIVNKLGIVRYFDEIIDGTKTTKAKPDPAVFLIAARALKVANSDCVIFEDSLAGVQAGNSEGMYVVGIGTPENLPGADQWIPDLSYLNMNALL